MWMGWATVVTLLLGAAAYLGERSARNVGLPGRWMWLTALVAALGLQGWSLLDPTPAPATPLEPTGPGAGAVDLTWLTDLQVRAAEASPVLLQRLDSALTIGWGVGALIAVLALAGGLHHLRARARRWDSARVAGEDVLLSADFGPALVGVWSPRIVLPRWALELPAGELRMTCMHEAQHREAKDTRLLFAAALATALMPWNVGLWWMLGRLRAAVELDCDERVLRGGASRSAYAALLLGMGTRTNRSRIPVLAFARPKSLLERRMRMIVRKVDSRRIVRAVPAAVAAMVLVVAACDTTAPTTPMDDKLSAALVASPAEGSIDEVSGTLVKLSEAGTRFLIDGKEVAEIPSDLDPALIERVEVSKGVDGEVSTVSVFLVKADASEPAVFIDGERLHTSDAKASLAQIDPESIERVDVRKSGEGDEIHISLKPISEGSARIPR